MIWNLILALGDSLTSGSRDEFRRGYPLELASLMNKEIPEQFWIVVNEGESKDASSDLAQRVYQTLKYYSESHLVLLMIGTNDAKENVPCDIFEDNLRYIIQICKVLHKKILLATLPSIIGTGLFMYSSESQSLIKEYNGIINNVGKEFNIPVVDMSALDKIRIDKVHFDNNGYKEMAKLWFEKIKEL